MGKESEKEWIHVHIYLNHSAALMKQTRHCKLTIFQDKIKNKFKGKKENNKVPTFLPLLRDIHQEFPGGLVVRIWGSHCHGPGSIPGQGT